MKRTTRAFSKKYEKTSDAKYKPTIRQHQNPKKIKVRAEYPPKDKYEQKTEKERNEYESTQLTQNKYENYTRCILIVSLRGPALVVTFGAVGRRRARKGGRRYRVISSDVTSGHQLRPP